MRSFFSLLVGRRVSQSKLQKLRMIKVFPRSLGLIEALRGQLFFFKGYSLEFNARFSTLTAESEIL